MKRITKRLIIRIIVRKISDKRYMIKIRISGLEGRMELMAESSFNKDITLSIESAKVFDGSCTPLKDSDCNTAAVKEDLVPADCLTGRVTRVTTFCCQNRRFPTAIVNLHCDYFSGPIEVCVIKDFVADVILGNIKGVRSLTVTSMVNVATWTQSKRATTKVHAGRQEILPESLVDSISLRNQYRSPLRLHPRYYLNLGVSSPCTPASKTVTSDDSRLYPSEEDHFVTLFGFR
ncbi:reverse transcriptase [Plakobranchus ocellatus]|uniref:Reverse transcriptase n=1 Tax=Plakobranchus ocellatus TaxID=259542 RepID=A0AAV4B1R3_9GAST|nr:reverse transcriptase [Plakobranchus ocellatus]